jgi:hypothetical protein
LAINSITVIEGILQFLGGLASILLQIFVNMLNVDTHHAVVEVNHIISANDEVLYFLVV